jgi:hypothetical protein
MASCMCDFDDECSGTGVLYCLGCGGDQCVCGRCFGEMPCDGCDWCEHRDSHDWEDDEPMPVDE